MDMLASFFESVFNPLLSALDRTGLFQALRFAPHYRVAAAITVLILTAYFSALLLSSFQRHIDRLRRLRIVGRIATIILAGWLTMSVIGNTKFVLERGGGASVAIQSNAGFFLILAFAIFLEIRFSRWKPRR